MFLQKKKQDTIHKNVYRPTHCIRIVTATSLYDGHDVSINIIRRALIQAGAESYSSWTQPFGT